jgi:hypothetical protein
MSYLDPSPLPSESYDYTVLGITPDGVEQRFGPVTLPGAGEQALHEPSLRARPNPSPGDVWLDLTAPGGVDCIVEAFDPAGRRVWHETVVAPPSGSFTLSWPATRSGLPSGVYMARASIGRIVTTRSVTLLR